MELIKILFLGSLAVAVRAAHVPEVHEVPPEEPSRTPRQLQFPRTHKQLLETYAQQDLQRQRYDKQRTSTDSYLRAYLFEQKARRENAATENSADYQLPKVVKPPKSTEKAEYRVHEAPGDAPALSDSSLATVKREKRVLSEPQVVLGYIDPQTDLQALHALLGRPPSAQLRGLNRLLGLQRQPRPFTPIMEEVGTEPPRPQPQLNILARAEAAYVPQHLVPAQPQQKPEVETYENNSKYAFGYRVKDFHAGNDFGHEEVKDGVTAKGHYHVLLPDGRLQNVDYWADETGFHAKITYTTASSH